MKLQDERDTMADRLQEETEFRKKMGDKLSHERHQSQKEKEGTQEVSFNKQHGVKIWVKFDQIKLSKCFLLCSAYIKDAWNTY